MKESKMERHNIISYLTYSNCFPALHFCRPETGNNRRCHTRWGPVPGGCLTRCVQVVAAAAPESRHQDDVECCCVVGECVYTGGDDGTIKVDSWRQSCSSLLTLPCPGLEPGHPGPRLQLGGALLRGPGPCG